MKCFTRVITTFFLTTTFYLILPQKAYAYLDPGTGSYVLSFIIAGLVGALFYAKRFLNKIKVFFKNLSSKENKT